LFFRANFALLPQNSQAMNITNKQNDLSNGKEVFATFMPYNGENRCVKCVLQSSKLCKDAPCSPDERQDGLRGFFRAANKSTSEFAIVDAFKNLLR
jgi:hypothetical protein